MEMLVMRRFLYAFLFVLPAISSCAQPKKGNSVFLPVSDKPWKNESVATFAQGCFWHTEIVFQSLYGVRDAVSGFSGGKTINPSYEEVCTGKTGHAECVQVYYDSTKISFETLVDAYFSSMDPTTLNRQGNDVGTEYRSVAFYRTEREKKVIEEAISKINASKKYRSRVVTEVQPFRAFYPAEDYHQEYIYRNPGNSYVQHVSIPEYLHFRSTFRGRFRQQ